MDPERHVFVVADGLGGHAAGDVASRLAVQATLGYFDAMYSDPHRTWQHGAFARAIGKANSTVFAASNHPERKGMGTTVVGLRLEGRKVSIAHVGDSRCYRLRDGVVELMTRDHSVGNALIAAGVDRDSVKTIETS